MRRSAARQNNLKSPQESKMTRTRTGLLYTIFQQPASGDASGRGRRSGVNLARSLPQTTVARSPYSIV